jgi:hypothetical protein
MTANAELAWLEPRKS